MPNQNTIVKALNFNGVGLHTGKNAKIIVEPAAVNHGIKFQRVDVENQPIISADVNLVTDTKRSTTLEKNNVKVITVEHLMSALYALKINNALIKIDSPEIPILHGSAKQYVDAILKVGVKQQSEKIEFLKNLSVFSVPARYPEAFGLYVVEALAAGIPVVLPDIGAFPEIVKAANGGRLYRSEDQNSFIESLDELLSQPAMSKSMGLKAHDFVIKEYANERLASQLVENVLTPIMANQ